MKNNLLLILVTGLLVLIISSIAWADNPTKDELKALIETNSAAISSNTSETADNATAISTNEGDIADNAAAISTNEGDIAGNAADITDILDRLEILESFHSCMNGRFCDMQNGTVRDNKTGLIWLKDASCWDKMDWMSARMEASGLYPPRCGLSDLSKAGDWRLPTKDEWESFIEDSIDDGYTDPVLCDAAGTYPWMEGDAFLRVKSEIYWSNTMSSDDYVWTCDMYGNFPAINPYPDEFFESYVWPVRSP